MGSSLVGSASPNISRPYEKTPTEPASMIACQHKSSCYGRGKDVQGAWVLQNQVPRTGRKCREPLPGVVSHTFHHRSLAPASCSIPIRIPEPLTTSTSPSSVLVTMTSTGELGLHSSCLPDDDQQQGTWSAPILSSYSVP